MQNEGFRHGAVPHTLHVSGATEARNSITAFQSEPRRAASRRHHSRDGVVVVPSMTAALLRVAGLMTRSPRPCSCAMGRGRMVSVGASVP